MEEVWRAKYNLFLRTKSKGGRKRGKLTFAYVSSQGSAPEIPSLMLDRMLEKVRAPPYVGMFSYMERKAGYQQTARSKGLP
jgi:hypothetical protein